MLLFLSYLGVQVVLENKSSNDMNPKSMLDVYVGHWNMTTWYIIRRLKRGYGPYTDHSTSVFTSKFTDQVVVALCPFDEIHVSFKQEAHSPGMFK